MAKTRDSLNRSSAKKKDEDNPPPTNPMSGGAVGGCLGGVRPKTTQPVAVSDAPPQYACWYCN